jgi:hypothetical protein
MLFIISLVLVFLGENFYAQGLGKGPGPGKGKGYGPGKGAKKGPGPGRGRHRRIFNVNSIITVTGTVQEIITIPADEKRRWPGVHLKLKTKVDTFRVHLGPKWFIEKQKINLKVKDKVSITGSMVKIEEKPALIASAITIDDEVIRLRDKRGFPLWRGKRPK